MLEVSRRDLILSSAGAALAFGLNGPVAFIGAAQAQTAAANIKFKLGDIEVIGLNEGGVEREVSAGMAKNADLAAIKAALKAAGASEDKIVNPFATTAIRAGGKTILFDTGFGANGAPTTGKMIESMKAAGLDPAAVSTVIISHFHPDHISGLWVKETSAPVFPNAEIMMPEAEYKFWTDPSRAEKMPEGMRPFVQRIQSTFPTWKNIKQFADGAELVPGVRAVSTPGHTVGHTSFQVSSGGQQLFVQGDVTGFAPLFLRNPGIHSGFDGDGALAEATRRKFYDRVIAEKAMLSAYHFGFPNVGKLSKDGAGFAFEPLKA